MFSFANEYNVKYAVVALNSKLELLNRLPNVQVPTLTDQLSGVSDRAQQAQTAVQNLQTSLSDVKSGPVTTVVTAITQRATRIDTALARIQDTVNTYQATVTRTQKRVTSTSNVVLLPIDVGTVFSNIAFHHLRYRTRAAYVGLLAVFPIPARFIRLE